MLVHVEGRIAALTNTELGQYLNLPLRTYSSGMVLRLAFAISTSVEPEILVLDEMISAGDRRFAEKAAERLDRLIAAASSLLVASHAPETVRKLCNKVALLREGRLVEIGPVDSILKRYAAEG
jgi:ABC-2 type transport system ATP-binding protein/lipopolysaccharide transport system ATP-binding protein